MSERRSIPAIRARSSPDPDLGLLDQVAFFVKSPTLLMQAALPGMRPGRSDEGVGQGVGPDNITVNLVQPGWIPVERHEGLDTARYAAEVPMRRLGTPENIAAMVAFLASDPASFVTGQRITVNDGHVI